jgi:hypothetical protein
MATKYIVSLLIVMLITFRISAPVGAAVFAPYNSKTENTLVVPQQQNDEPTYADGWNQGYKDGWCYGRGYGCYPAYPPYPPYPRYGEDSYKGGYNRGFLQGIADHKAKDPN